ncbi:28S ribosomal protein S27, mitochondrial [Pieris rapae]|uniref:28S ribosomal protein S27, mitochondrial n=1 Tax=Pieris rapae TaxID=64459 RepID=UPI001E27EAA4|nr:28S ribosomal protein S27, mitochondrial [Pieris rapae]
MFRSLRNKFLIKIPLINTPKNTFLTNDYKCANAWNSQVNSTILTKVNLGDFYTSLDQNYSSKGTISAIDVDIFANAVRDGVYLEELKDLLHKLRLSGETGNTLESTHHATVRNFMEFGNIQELVDILKNPLNYGIFLDYYTANLLLDKLIKSQDYEMATNVAALIMLQEDYTNEITCSLCQYACYKFITEHKPDNQEQPKETEKNKKVEEVKIRIKFLRNPYFDDHFDIKDIKLLSGKTLACISKCFPDNVCNNLQILGWLFYKKYDQLSTLVDKLSQNNSFKVHKEVIDILKSVISEESKECVDKCINLLSNVKVAEGSLEESIKNLVENAINKSQSKDISLQEKMFKEWEVMREQKLQEQITRLDRIKRVQAIEEKQSILQKEEQLLWFFENEEKIDLQIEEKEQMEDKSQIKRKSQDKSDEDYIPPEILPKRR